MNVYSILEDHNNSKDSNDKADDPAHIQQIDLTDCLIFITQLFEALLSSFMIGFALNDISHFYFER